MYTTVNLVFSLILSHLGCCNDQKLQSSRDFTPERNWLVYSAPYDGPTQFSLCENYKCPSWTLPLQNLSRFNGPAHCSCLTGV